MRKKILFLFFFFLLAGALYSVPLPPKKQQKKIKSQDGVLTELLPDKSIAPRINGRILKKPYVHIQDENQLDKVLERHSVNYKNKITNTDAAGRIAYHSCDRSCKRRGYHCKVIKFQR